MDQNRQIRAAIWKSVARLTDDQLNKRTSEGTWTIIQNLEHLYLIEQAVTKQIKLALEKEEIEPADEKSLHLALDRSRKIEAPAHLIPSEDYMTLQQVKGKLDRSRQELEDTILEVSDDELRQKSFVHRVFGLMDLRQWVTLIGLHEKRHLEQIEEVKQAL